jgi:hypothetical protein
MPSIYDNYQRDGVSSLLKLARALCNLVNTFAPIIIAKYPDVGSPIRLLLAAAQNLCVLLPAAIVEADLYTGSNDPLIADPDNALGINPSAPPAPDPDAEV